MKAITMITLAALLLGGLAGCLDADSEGETSTTSTMSTNAGVFVVDVPDADLPANTQISSSQTPLEFPITFFNSPTGFAGPEPSVGVTSSGCIFGAALEKVVRSCDGGKAGSWESVEQIPQCQPSTSDPYLWVDPVTDRIFNVQMVVLVGTWICWSDDDGETWLGNPYDQGPLPVNDHIKLGTGPWTGAGYGLLGGTATTNVYETAAYFCYNKIAGVFCYTSFDGGVTFPVGGQVLGLAATGAGLHGAIATAPDGTVYVEPRVATPTVIFSKDNGLTWEARTMGEDVGTTNPRKNSEVAADADSNAYHVWTGGDEAIYMSRSFDSGNTWEQTSIQVSPDGVISSAFPHIDASSPGHIAVAYLASTDVDMLGTPDIDGNPWSGNAHTAPNTNVTYDLYVTYSYNADEENPDFYTVKITEDPVQIGSICLSSGDCRDIGGSNRNLLDFNDLHLDREGRVYIAYTDGCTGDCAENWKTLDATASRDRELVVAIQQTGLGLIPENGDLAPISY